MTNLLSFLWKYELAGMVTLVVWVIVEMMVMVENNLFDKWLAYSDAPSDCKGMEGIKNTIVFMIGWPIVLPYRMLKIYHEMNEWDEANDPTKED